MKSTTKSDTASKHSPLSYNKYLKVNELKQLQECQSDPAHHDEPLFIIIHQAYELWFKLILHEIDIVIEFLNQDNVYRATFFMRRIVAIMKLLVQQIHILETMSPKDFLGFRYNLNPASGFQSSQFREIEIAGGARDEALLKHFEQDPVAFESLKVRWQAPSLAECFYNLLDRQGFKMPKTGSEELIQQERITQLLKIYEQPEEHAALYDLAELFVDFDELIYLWRTHHVTVVERIIGFKRGTGGSEGVGYLQSTLRKRCFPELWQLRTRIGEA